MSAPLFLVPSLPEGGSYTLAGAVGHHAAGVQRLRVGEKLLLGDGRGGTASAVVRAVGKGTLDVAVGEITFQERPDPRLVVIQGIPKGDRAELAVQAMTEAGADEIVPWAASRSVVQWRGERGAKARERWAATAREAAKQARRAWVPVIGDEIHRSCAFVLHEEATERLSTVDLPASGEIALVVGPEGGIGPEELAAFEAKGARPVRLGPEVLRTSTAGVAAIAVLSARLGRW